MDFPRYQAKRLKARGCVLQLHSDLIKKIKKNKYLISYFFLNGKPYNPPPPLLIAQSLRIDFFAASLSYNCFLYIVHNMLIAYLCISQNAPGRYTSLLYLILCGGSDVVAVRALELVVVVLGLDVLLQLNATLKY